MKTELKWRLAIVAAVIVISIILIYPTVYYFLAVSGYVPATPEQIDKLRLRSVPLGLDLQGGVDVLLALDEGKMRDQKMTLFADDLTKRFREESPSIDATVELTTGTTPEIAVTLNKADQERSADNILRALKNTFPSYAEGSVKAGQVLRLQADKDLLKQNIQQTVDSAIKVIRNRVDTLGVTQPSVAKQGDNRIRVQIPGEKNPEQVIKTVIKPAVLEFRGVKTADSQDAEGRYREDSASYIDPKTGKPLEGKSIPPGYEVKLYRHRAENKQTAQMESVDSYILVKTKIEMTGDSLQDAWVSINQGSFENPVQVNLEFKPDGARKFGEVTTTYVHKPLAIVLDDVVYSYPNINQVIDTGNAVITGSFTPEEGRELSLVLKAGALPAAMTAIQKQTVEATLGADSIKASVVALVIGSVLIALLMICYYHQSGVIAMVAVIIHNLIIVMFMKLANATLTLSGIGGILLTVGMAVDANVLIYERIREELRAGKNLRHAISLGFNRAFSVIFDGNLTTLISGLTLLQFGQGSVRGFALTLNLGIIATLFTGLFCTHALVDGWFALRGKLGLGNFSFFKPGFRMDFVKLCPFSYTFSGILLALSIIYVLPIPGLPRILWGVDFEGGLLSNVTTTQKLTTQQVQGSFNNWRVQKVQGENNFLVRTKFAEGSKNPIDDTQKTVSEQLTKTVGAGQFTISGNDAVGNEVGKEFTFMALLSTIIASAGILLYMAYRFEFLFGLAAVVALFHDLIITFGIFCFLGHIGLAGEVTLDVVSALLVILGYSVNDTIIIFDRIRENLKLHPSRPMHDNINISICESLNRTLMTVGAVLLAMIVILIFGGKGLYDFALVLLIGIIKGTYSSSFIASPLLDQLEKYRLKRMRLRSGAGTKVVQPMLKN